MNISQLEYLVETVQAGSYARAAKSLFVTPQAISKSIGELEKELDVTLIVKKGRGISPTDFAFALSARAEDALQSIADLKLFAKRSKEIGLYHGSLTIALSTSYHRIQLFQDSFFEEFCEKYPGISLKTMRFSTDSCISALHLGIADAVIAFSKDTNDGFSSAKMFSFAPYVALSAKSKLKDNDGLSLRDLSSFKIALPEDLSIYSIVKARFESRNVLPEFESCAPFASAHQAFIDAGGAVLVSKSTNIQEMLSDVCVRPICPTDAFSIPVYYIHREANNPTLSDALRLYISKKSKTMRKSL